MRFLMHGIVLGVIAALVAASAYALLFQWTADTRSLRPSVCAGLSQPAECIAAAQEGRK